MIRLNGITKSYLVQGFSRNYVFRDLSLELPGKTHIGVVGRNGAGKSTFLRLLSGTEVPDRGRIETDGAISPPLGLANGFANKVSGRDNARFVARVSGDDERTARERVAYVHAFSELGEFFERPVMTYSSGMRARLAFAISVSFDYDYYLIDELTAVGDRRFREKANQTFAALKGKASIVMASHNLDTLRRECSVGIYLRRGEVEYFEDINDAVNAYIKEQRA